MQIQKEKTIYIPSRTISLLIKEFNLKEEDIDSYIAGIIERIVSEHAQNANSEVFSGDEVKEIEDNLKGLGYI